MASGYMQSQRLITQRGGWALWLRWVLANAVGELIGLGAAAVLGVLLAQAVEATFGAFAGLALAGVFILLGTFEGVVVGVAQWLVLRRPFPALRWQAWLLASAVGAFVAWTLGMLPSTLMGAATGDGGPPAPDIDGPLMYALAAGMGAVLGPVLGVPQWLVLRRHAPRAGWWVLANVVAWAAGMPVVFIGAGAAPSGGLLGIVVTGLLTATAAGAVVGALHGLVLVWLARR